VAFSAWLLMHYGAQISARKRQVQCLGFTTIAGALAAALLCG
jgi:hypothetical protein